MELALLEDHSVPSTMLQLLAYPCRRVVAQVRGACTARGCWQQGCCPSRVHV